MAIYTKKVSVGSFLKKGTDIKDADIVEVRSEGIKVPGEFGVQDIFIVKTSEGKEGNTNFNQTSINNLIDAYGIDSKKWIGQKVKAWIIRQNVGGSFKQVLYFSHPNALFTEEGFVLEGAMECERTAGVGSVETDEIPVIEEGEIDVKDIPF